MQRSIDAILTTHTGSLPRLPAILEAMRDKEEGRLADEAAFQKTVSSEIAAMVQRQVDSGIDVVNDGECGKPNFHAYASERLSGFERRVPDQTAERSDLSQRADRERCRSRARAGYVLFWAS